MIDTLVKDDNDVQVDWVTQIAAQRNSARRNALISDFMRDYNPQNIAIAKRLVGKFRGRIRLDDAFSLVQRTAYDKLITIDSTEEIRNWAGWLSHAVYKATSKELDRDNFGGMSGTETMARRRRALAKTRSELAKKIGYDPSNAEVMEANNERIRASQLHPEKHGALATNEDFQPILLAEPNETTMSGNAGGSPNDVFCMDTVDAIITACEQISDELACLAEAWLWFEEGILCIEESPAALAESMPMNISAKRASKLLAEAKAVAAHVVLDRAAAA